MHLTRTAVLAIASLGMSVGTSSPIQAQTRAAAALPGEAGCCPVQQKDAGGGACYQWTDAAGEVHWALGKLANGLPARVFETRCAAGVSREAARAGSIGSGVSAGVIVGVVALVGAIAAAAGGGGGGNDSPG